MNSADTITWEERRAVSERLIGEAEAFSPEFFTRVKGQCGLLVFVYCGQELGGRLWDDPVPQIIFVGHNDADSIRHWQDDTAISTVRRSLAALLSGSYALEARPKSADPADADRFANYRLAADSESRLTAWMKENIRIAFQPTPPEAQEAYYLALIDYNTPMFNFQHNPNNKMGNLIKTYRLQMAEQAARCEP